MDKGDAFLDTYELEKKRGITIFSKQARLAWDDMDVTILDTPGHVDFSAEMERVLQVLDYAVLVISGSDGVQGHTRTLWRLLARYQIPAFLFINKMDLAPGREQEVLRDLKESLGGNFVERCDPQPDCQPGSVSVLFWFGAQKYGRGRIYARFGRIYAGTSVSGRIWGENI